MTLPASVSSLKNRLAVAYFVLVAGLTTLVYVTAQQGLRQGADDPQIQMAEDAAASLDSGHDPSSLSSPTTVNMRASLAPFIVITDTSKKVLVTTGKLDGRIVSPPDGAFDAARTATDHESRITWQPVAGVREAAVIVSHEGGYVLAARNLREVEARESLAQDYALLVFGALVVIGLILIVVIK